MKGGKKSGILALVLAIAAIAGSRAADYRPDEFLNLDLSHAVLSPKLLGPSSRFVPLPPVAASNSKAENAGIAPEPQNSPTVSGAKPASKISVAKVDQARSQRRRGNRPHQFARHHGNPLDAQAMVSRPGDRRIHAWPCRTGGICNWRQ